MMLKSQVNICLLCLSELVSDQVENENFELVRFLLSFD